MRSVAFGAGVAAALGVASVAAASLDDPDAPVVTARYIAGPEITRIQTPADAPLPVATAAAYIAPQPSPVRRLDLTADEVQPNVDAGGGQLTGLATKSPIRRDSAILLARLSTPLSQLAQDRNLRRGFGEMQAAAAKARLYIFAGDRGGVWTYSFTRDSTGVKAAGWSSERADQHGEQQIGLAWQNGRARIALTGMERKFCQFGAEMKDRVVAMSVSISPGWFTRRDRQSG